MHHIAIHNFGPIRHIEMPIRELTILIGPNGAGKSVVGKLVYLLKAIPDELFWFVHGPQWQNVAVGDFWEVLAKQRLPRLFRSAFGSRVYIRPESEVVFSFDPARAYTLTLRGTADYLMEVVAISEALETRMQAFLAVDRQTYGRAYSSAQLWEEVQAVFGGRGGRQFRRFLVPARGGRAWLEDVLWGRTRQGLYEQDGYVAEGEVAQDLWVREFLAGHFADRKLFAADRDDGALFLAQEARLGGGMAYGELAERSRVLRELLAELIQGQYEVSDTGKESILIADGTRLPLEMAASGVGELTGLWPALTQAVFRVAQGATTFMCVEEPEAHLYPVAQHKTVQALALALNAAPGNQLLVNTHSPYILVAFDNLITAAEIARERPEAKEAVRKVVSESLWIDYDKVSAVFVEDGALVTEDDHSEYQSILDRERRGLGGTKLDQSARDIEEIFERLLDLRYPMGENA